MKGYLGMKKALCLLISLFLLGCSGQEKSGEQTQDTPAEQVSLEFRVADDEPAEGLIESVFAITGETFYLHAEPMFDESGIDSAYLMRGGENPLIGIILNKDAAESFEKVTGENVGKRTAILVNGKLVSVPKIRAAIPGGRAMLTSGSDLEETKRIIKSLNKK